MKLIFLVLALRMSCIEPRKCLSYITQPCDVMVCTRAGYDFCARYERRTECNVCEKWNRE